MAGSKHERSRGTGGTGEVSPLAAQLQQAWLQTQIPKVQKRTFISVAKQPSRLSPTFPVADQSALKSLSSIFPELASMPEEKKPMISSVFKDGEEQHPPPPWRKLKSECLSYMISDVPPTRRSLSASLVERSSDSSSFSAHGPLSTSQSFSGTGTKHSDPEPYLEGFSPLPNVFDDMQSSTSFADFEPESTADLDPESAAEIDEEKNPFLSYLSNILMDENMEEKKCMFVEMSAYQAMAKELGDLITDDSPSPPFSYSSKSPEAQEEENEFLDSWIEGILSIPLPAEADKHFSDTGNGFASEEASVVDVHSPPIDSESGSSNTLANGRDTESDPLSLCPWSDAGVPPTSNSDEALYKTHPENSLTKYVHMKPERNGVHIPPVDLTNLLMRCAQAVEQSDFRHANELIGELRQHSSAYGNGPQRMAHYFMEALVARMSGTGGQLYSALSNNLPSAADMLKAYRLFVNSAPFVHVIHFIANRTIIEAFAGASRVHIVDYGILYGAQWPCLIHQLATRPGGPPHLRITGIDRPQPGFKPSERIQETGRRLAKLAMKMKVPFEYHAIAEKWEAITPAHLFLKDDEVLAVNCIFRLRHLLDETVTAASPRQLVLSRIRSMNPKVFVHGLVNAGYNAPFFMSRFREALYHFSTLFDAIEGSMPLEHPDRVLLEQEMIGREILNVVACEGLERVERPEPYRQWQSRTLRAGFTQVPILPELVPKINTTMRIFNKNYGIGWDGNWFLMGWKERIVHAVSVWVPTSTSVSP